jgi:hypothetical protein
MGIKAVLFDIEDCCRIWKACKYIAKKNGGTI